jgi:hypothetical protein
MITFYRGQIRRDGQLIGCYARERHTHWWGVTYYRAWFSKDGSTDRTTWASLDVVRLSAVRDYIS